MKQSKPTNTPTTETLAAHKLVKLSVAEWNTLFRYTLENYKAAVWAMAEMIELGSSKFGRDNLVKMTPFDEKKINWFNSIARLNSKDTSLLPELNYESISSKVPAYWLKRAKNEGLKPSQLRKLVRETNSSFKKEKNVKCARWPKALIDAENELNRSDISPENQKAVADRLKPIVDLYNRFQSNPLN